MNLLKLRIPTLFGLFILLAGLASGVYLTLQNQTTNSRAATETSPKSVTVATFIAMAVLTSKILSKKTIIVFIFKPPLFSEFKLQHITIFRLIAVSRAEHKLAINIKCP